MILAVVIAAAILLFSFLLIGAGCIYVWYQSEKEMNDR